MQPTASRNENIGIARYTFYNDMLNLQINLALQGRTIYDLDNTEVANLEFIARDNCGTAGAQAKGILETAYGYHFCDCLYTINSVGYKSSVRLTSLSPAQ